MKPGETRSRVLWALAGSLVLHGGLLLLALRMGQPAPSVRAPSPSSTRVVLFDVVRLVQSGNGSRAPEKAPAPRREAARPLSAKPRAAEPEPSRDLAPPAAPQPVAASTPDEVAPAPAPARAAATGGDPARGEVAPGEANGSGAPGGVASGASGSGKSPGMPGGDVPGPALAALHQRLQEAVGHCYPAAASRFRVKGEVMISFCLDAVGNATSVAQVASSGSALLDRAATECVLPGALPVPGATGCYRVPVVFGTR